MSEDLEKYDKEIISLSGMDFNEKVRGGSFLQKDNELIFSRSFSKGVEILSVEEAKKYTAFKKYWGEAFNLLERDFPHDTEGGYFIYIEKNKKVELPLQACLFLKKQGFKQKVHNLVIVEEGASVYLVTGCSASPVLDEGFHLGINEFFVKKGAYLNFTMIHNWKETVSVEPLSIAIVEEEANFISNYICLRPVKEIIMYPTAVLEGKFAKVSFNSLILSHPNSFQDIGSRIILRAPETKGEIISRAVSRGGTIVARGHIKAESENTKAHLECRGLIISSKGKIHTIPELETDFKEVDLSHEAAIGKISQEEIEYLCSRGFTQQQAQSLIVRGFMDVDILNLPPLLKQEIDRLEEQNLKNGF